MSLLSNETLVLAIERLSCQKDFAKKLEWWLVSPHSAERWLQFELAYQLNHVFLGEYLVACEIKVGGSLADLAVFNAAGARSPLWSNPPIELLELKMPGNWHVKKGQIEGFHADIEKINDYPLPSVALACCVEVCGIAKGDLYDWCFSQIDSVGKTYFDDMYAALTEKAPGAIERLKMIEVPSGGQCFTSMRLHPCIYRNTGACGN